MYRSFHRNVAFQLLFSTALNVTDLSTATQSCRAVVTWSRSCFRGANSSTWASELTKTRAFNSRYSSLAKVTRSSRDTRCMHCNKIDKRCYQSYIYKYKLNVFLVHTYINIFHFDICHCFTFICVRNVILYLKKK
jgi:hypothetical protein